MRVHPSKRAFLRRFPAPPPTPDGKVWWSGYLVDASAVQAVCAQRMGRYDIQRMRRAEAFLLRSGLQGLS